MSGSLRHAWEYLAAEMWEPLADYSATSGAAPPDLFSDLYATADEFLSPRPTGTALGEARNDADRARQRFLALKGTDFASESAMVHFLEAADAVIADYEISGFEDLYRCLLRDALRKFNLRYRLDEPFILRFLLPGSFTNLYAELHRLNVANGHLAGLLNDFEKAFDRYARTQDPTDLKTCIAKASNYAEGLASATRGTAGTLGALCDQLTDWPHDKVREALKSLYKFCSDYPGIRHAGDPAGVRRDLATRDVTLASLLLVSFSGYLSPNVDEQVVLGA
ncbi:MAG: hypothetical protein F9K18_01475 [Thermoanaerobaculia bacterium]|nr:MAG: hypothetical protein F9K18_01475 [Thermoanaerobaculia bacterium]